MLCTDGVLQCLHKNKPNICDEFATASHADVIRFMKDLLKRLEGTNPPTIPVGERMDEESSLHDKISKELLMPVGLQ